MDSQRENQVNSIVKSSACGISLERRLQIVLHVVCFVDHLTTSRVHDCLVERQVRAKRSQRIMPLQEHDDTNRPLEVANVLLDPQRFAIPRRRATFFAFQADTL